MQQQLHVRTVGVQAMASRWGASAGELDEVMAPAVLGLSCQASATSVNAAHADVAVFTAALAARLRVRATHVAEARTRYSANEARSTKELASVIYPVTGV
jgi:hypothetical protein